MELFDFFQKVRSSLLTESIFYFRAKISPGAGKTEITDIMKCEELTVKIKVAAVAEKGKANAALCKFLGKEFGCECEVVAGQTSSIKLLRFSVKNK